MATKKISELEAITEADGSDALVIVDVSEGKTNKITKNNLLKGSGHTIEMSLNENYQIVLKLKNAEGTELSTATIDLPNENAITNISYSNGTLTLTKQSGVTSTVDISGLINGLATETALTNLANALKETIGIDTNTYNESQTYNTGDIVIQNEKIYKANQDNITGTFDSSKWDEISLYEYQKLQDEAIEENYEVITKLQEDVEDLTERVEDAENNEMTNTPTPATSHYLQDSADARFRKFIPIGRTTQESTTGANILPIIPKGSVTTSGVTLTSNGDGSFTVQGTATKEDTVYFSLDNPVVLPNETMYIHLRNNSINNSASLYLASYTKSTSSQFSLVNRIMASTNLIGETLRIIGVHFNSSAVLNVTFTPSIELTNEETAYELYTGGEPAPSPSFPFPIKNTGDNVNLFDKDNANILNAYFSDNIITSNSANRMLYLKCKPNTAYTITKAKTNYFVIGCTSKIPEIGDTVINKQTGTQGNYDGTTVSQTYTTDSTAQYLVCRFYQTSMDTAISLEDVLASIKIEPGTKATPYSPYGCGNVNEKVQNKNLFTGLTKGITINASTGVEGTDNNSATSDYTSVDFTANPNYYLSGLSNNLYSFVGAYNKNKQFLGRTNATKISEVLLTNTLFTNGTPQGTGDIAYIRVRQYYISGGSGSIDDVDNLKIQLEKGSTATSYVPHSEQNISFPLAKNIHFYKDAYFEKENNKWYVVNFYEYFEYPEISKMDRFTIRDKTTLVSFLDLNMNLQLKTYNYNCMSNCFIARDVYNTDQVGVMVHATNKGYSEYVYFGIPNELDLTTKQEAYNWLKENVTLLYPLETPEKIEITDETLISQLEAMQKIRTYKNITHISSEDETPANVEIEYVVDINTIDDRITALEARVDLLEE